MTPPARLEAAIGLMDQILAGTPADKTMTNWGRHNRYAGSKDRAAVRDLVFDCLRQQRSAAVLGGSATGRGLILGLLRLQDLDPENLFTGEKYAPAVLTDDEKTHTADLASQPEEVRLDCPDWAAPLLKQALGADFAGVMQATQSRAPMFLRVNARKATVDAAQALLSNDGITTQTHPLAPMALEVTENPRRVAQSNAYSDGLVEVQDVASQAVIEFIPFRNGMKILDFCAGGGGKSLAMAAKTDGDILAYDTSAPRMKDIPVRAARAGVTIKTTDVLADVAKGSFDVVLVDAPCSGSGTWRRNPASKWALQPQDLLDFVSQQQIILNEAAAYVAPQGVLVYVTCSLFDAENRDQITTFMAENPTWHQVSDHRYTPVTGGDGLFVAVMAPMEQNNT